MGKLVIDVADLVHRPGAGKAINFAVPVEGLKGVLGRIEDGDPVELDLSAESVREGVWVFGDVAGTLHLQCSRCLVEYEQRFEKQVDEIFYYDPDMAEARDSYAVTDNHLDLEPMIRDAVVLDIPTHPVHSEACKGLCPVCGADRNVENCGHDAAPVDLRWAPLQSILGPQKG